MPYAFTSRFIMRGIGVAPEKLPEGLQRMGAGLRCSLGDHFDRNSLAAR
jgi:hypothetical protein